MKLISFSAKNYRSISTAYKLPLTEYTVIVGPNNEGKSNILKGLGLALGLLTDSQYIRFGRHSTYSALRHRAHAYGNRTADYLHYDWDRDFPVNLQEKKPTGRSEFTCEFELDALEFEEFRSKTLINLTTNLKVKIMIGKELEPKFEVLMNGKGKSTLNKKNQLISEFINDKLLLQYIPAIRTSAQAIKIVNSLLEKEFSILENDHDFKKVIEKIAKLQQPIIKKISDSLKKSISSFIPDVRNISIKNNENIGELLSASCRVYVDDGIETDLELKGDGVISLTAISLLQDFSKGNSLGRGLILLLEEPESHLHPKAIHNLKKVLYEISNTSQVIITTHSPIMIERLNLKQNIIVQDGKAVSARGVDDIRNSLGITMSDNLSSAYLVLLVEGEEDILLLRVWLEEKSDKIKTAILNGTLVFDHLAGATNVGYKTSLYKSNLCNVVAYLDNDKSGRLGIENAESKGILKTSEYILSVCKGMSDSELEDLIDFDVYKKIIFNDYGVDLNTKSFKNNKKQWSDRIKESFSLAGKKWGERLEVEIKNKVINEAVLLKSGSLNIHKANSIDSLILTIETVLSNQK